MKPRNIRTIVVDNPRWYYAMISIWLLLARRCTIILILSSQILPRWYIWQMLDWKRCIFDLTPCDYWLWRIVKECVYNIRSLTLMTLKNAKRPDSAPYLWNIISYMVKKLHRCTKSQEEQLEGVRYLPSLYSDRCKWSVFRCY